MWDISSKTGLVSRRCSTLESLPLLTSALLSLAQAKSTLVSGSTRRRRTANRRARSSESPRCSALARVQKLILPRARRVNSYIRVLGTIKTFSGKRSVNCSRVRVITDMNEINFHLVEVAWVTQIHKTGGPVSGQLLRGSFGDFR